ncbi:MAG: TraB/GumN family protein [Ideonella sp.]|nr:TraB/GumN family protein [Ideonella sp.]
MNLFALPHRLTRKLTQISTWAATALFMLAHNPLQANTNCPPAAAPLTQDEVAQGMQAARLKGLFWEARKDGRSLWLYGTVHAAQRSWMFPGPELLQAMRQADQVALELDMMDAALMQKLQAAVMAPADEPKLPPELRARLDKAAAAECAESLIKPMRAEFQAITLTTMVARRQGVDPSYGIDGFLAGLARGLGKPVVSLETPEAQLAVLLPKDEATRIKMVDETLKGLETGQAAILIKRLTDAWAQGKLEELENYGQWCDCLNTPEQKEFHKRLIDDRNLDMARKTTALHAQGKQVFVAVGALHMTGPQGLPALLKAQGFEVRRVMGLQ